MIWLASNSFGKPPEPLNLEDRAHRGENWKNFKREWSYYEIAAGIATKAEKVRVAALLNVIGRDALDMWESEGDNFKIAKVLEKFEERCVPARNEILERDNFFKRDQNKGESLDAYITTLLKLSETCAFGELRESLVRDRLVYGIRDDQVREKLLGKRQLDLDKCIEILKSGELTHYQAKDISVDEAQTNYVRRDRQKFNEGLKNKGTGSVKHTKVNSKNATKRQKETTPTSEEIEHCQYCGRCHQNKKEMCPAWGNGVECARKSDIFGKCVDHLKYTKFRKNSKMSSIYILIH